MFGSGVLACVLSRKLGVVPWREAFGLGDTLLRLSFFWHLLWAELSATPFMNVFLLKLLLQIKKRIIVLQSKVIVASPKFSGHECRCLNRTPKHIKTPLAIIFSVLFPTKLIYYFV